MKYLTHLHHYTILTNTRGLVVWSCIHASPLTDFTFQD